MVVYFAEYTINQSVATTLVFEHPRPFRDDPARLYPWFQFLYQAGVWALRSSVNLVPVKRVWIPALLQVVNLCLLVGQSLSRVVPSAYVALVFVFWEGLLGGATYVNAFFQISKEVRAGMWVCLSVCDVCLSVMSVCLSVCL